MTLSLLVTLFSAFPAIENPDSVHWIDLDGDGHVDRVSVALGVVTFARNTGARNFESSTLSPLDLWVSEVLVEDLDRDGRLDLYLISPSMNLALVADGLGGFFDRTLELGLSEPGPALGIQAIDLDRDGTRDLILRKDTGDMVFWGEPEGGFQRDAAPALTNVELSDAALARVVSAPGFRVGGSPFTGESSASASRVSTRPGSDGVEAQAAVGESARERRSTRAFSFGPDPLAGSGTIALEKRASPFTIPSGAYLLWEQPIAPRGFSSTPWSLQVGSPAGWSPGSPLTMPRRGAAFAVYAEKLYLFSGDPTQNSPRDVHVYDASTQSWMQRMQMPGPQGYGVAAEVGGMIYVCGGQMGQLNSHDQVRRYDPLLDTWASRAPLPTPAARAAGGAIDGKVYVIGGVQSGPLSALSGVQEYDPVADSWTTQSALLPAGRYAAASVVLDGKLYLIGGSTSGLSGVADVEVYDPLSDTFSARAPVPVANSQSVATLLDGKIHLVLGSLGSGSYPAGTYVYDPTDDTWTAGVAPSASHADGAMAVLNGQLHVVGGFDGFSETDALEIFDPGAPLLRFIQKN